MKFFAARSTCNTGFERGRKTAMPEAADHWDRIAPGPFNSAHGKVMVHPHAKVRICRREDFRGSHSWIAREREGASELWVELAAFRIEGAWLALHFGPLVSSHDLEKVKKRRRRVADELTLSW